MTVIEPFDRETDTYGRGDYGTEYAGDLIRIIEDLNCSKGRCVHAGSDKDREEFGPGGNCRSLASLFAGIPIPEFDPQPDGIHAGDRRASDDSRAEPALLVTADEPAEGRVPTFDPEDFENYVPSPIASPSVPVESREQPREWPLHWVNDQKLDDLHALWHDQPGNMMGERECGREHCEFWLSAQFALDVALPVEMHHRQANLLAERDRARDLAAHLEEQLAQVAALHMKFDGGGDRSNRCANDGFPWPCATARALAQDTGP